MKRTIIKINEERCNGCGACVTGCHEGALQLINGKAVMVSELFCDGLGACIGDCPVGAIELEEREAEPYDEIAVMERLVPKGETVVLAHLNHLKEHGEKKLLEQGLNFLKEHNIPISFGEKSQQCSDTMACGCPGSMARSFTPAASATSISGLRPATNTPSTTTASELRQFPVQLHLVNPYASFFHGSDLLLAADCAAFASGEFHNRFLKGKMLAIACPKLDSNTNNYVDKLTAMIDEAMINTLTVVIMEVPCCGGLLKIAQMARQQAQRNIPIKLIILTVQGQVKKDEWI